MKRFDDKVVLVVGGGAGIGRAVATQLAKEGAKVAIMGRSLENGEATLRAICAYSDGLFVQGDAANEADVARAVSDVMATFGRIDGLYNNVGITGARMPLLSHTVESMEQVLLTNVRSAFLSMKYVMPHMLEQGGGAIVNTASMAGLDGYPTLAPYSASKHAIIGLTKSVVGEVSASNIRINVVAPGPTFTETVLQELGASLPPSHIEAAKQQMASKIPLGRLGTPEDIAAVGCFLLSDDASFVNGAVVSADGGLTAF